MIRTKISAIAISTLFLTAVSGCESDSSSVPDAGSPGICAGRGPAACSAGRQLDPVSCLCVPVAAVTDAGADTALDASCAPIPCPSGAPFSATECRCVSPSPGDAGDAKADATGDAAGACEGRDEAACNAGACFALRGLPLVEYCRSGSMTVFAGCVSGGPDGGAAITWGKETSTGKELQFPTTQLPPSFTPVATPTCPGDAAVD